MSGRYVEITVDDKIISDLPVEKNPIAITYGIDDNEDFTSVSGNKSNAITLPATKNTLALYGHFNEPETIQSGQINFKKGIINVDGVNILRGKTQLIQTVEKSNPESIDVAFWGNNVDWIIALKGKSFGDLLFDVIDLAGDTIRNSWAGTYDTGWKYAAFPVHYGNWYRGNSISDDDIRPHLYIRHIIDLIFKRAGYRLDSSFMNTAFFKKLCYVFNGDVNVNRDMNDVVGGIFQANNKEVTYHTVADPGTDTGYYNTIFRYEILEPGEYNFSFLLTKETDFPSENDFRAGLYIESAPVANDGYLPDNPGLSLLDISEIYHPVNVPTLPQTVVLLTTRRFTTQDVGKHVRFVMLSTKRFVDDVGAAYDAQIDSTANVSRTSTYVTGQPIYLSNVYSDKLQTEFLKGLTEMFNLKWTCDELKKTVYCEPRDYINCKYASYTPFYKRNERNEWTEKRDVSKTLTVKRYESESNIILSFKKDDSDVNVKAAEKGSSLPLYANRTQINDAQDYSEKEKQNAFFSPCFHIYDSKVKNPDSANPYYLPCCWTTEKPADEEPQLIFTDGAFVYLDGKGVRAQSFAIGDKIVYYEGESERYEILYHDANQSPDLQLSAAPLAYQVNYDVQPADITTTPNLAYCDVGVATGYMPGLVSYFFMNLFASYMAGKNVFAYFLLSLIDIAHLDFRKVVSHKGDIYVLQSVNSYNPFIEDSTEANLLYDKQYDQADIDRNIISEIKGFTNG